MLLIIIIIIPTKTQKKKKMNEKTNKQTQHHGNLQLEIGRKVQPLEREKHKIEVKTETLLKQKHTTKIEVSLRFEILDADTAKCV